MDSYYRALAKGQINDKQDQEQTARSYSNKLLENYMNSINARKEDIAIRKQAVSEMAPEQDVGISDINLRPLAAFADAITGSRIAQSYDPPPTETNKNEMILKLRNAIGKDEASVTDDEMNLVRLMNEDERVRDRMLMMDENKDLDRELKQMLGEKSINDRGIARAQKAQAKASQEKLIPASAAENLADLRSQINSVHKIKEEWSRMIGPVGGVGDYLRKNLSSRVPNTNEAKYRSSLKQKAQTIGKALEGGKLTDVDYEKYIHFLPQPGDTEEMAQQRIDNLIDALQNAYNTRIASYNEVGYSTGTLPSMRSSSVQTNNGQYKIILQNTATGQTKGFTEVLTPEEMNDAKSKGWVEVK